MKIYAVGLADFFNNDLQIVYVRQRSIRDAVIQASMMQTADKYRDSQWEFLQDLPDDLDDIKQYFFDADMLVGVSEYKRP